MAGNVLSEQDQMAEPSPSPTRVSPSPPKKTKQNRAKIQLAALTLTPRKPRGWSSQDEQHEMGFFLKTRSAKDTSIQKRLCCKLMNIQAQNAESVSVLISQEIYHHFCLNLKRLSKPFLCCLTEPTSCAAFHKGGKCFFMWF